MNFEWKLSNFNLNQDSVFLLEPLSNIAEAELRGIRNIFSSGRPDLLLNLANLLFPNLRNDDVSLEMCLMVVDIEVVVFEGWYRH